MTAVDTGNKRSEALKKLKAMIFALQSHISLAEEGKIQEDCIECRKKDLDDYMEIFTEYSKMMDVLETLSARFLVFDEPFMERIEFRTLWEGGRGDYLKIRKWLEEEKE